MRRLETWLSLPLLLILIGHAAGQLPPPQPNQPDPKLPALLTAKPLQEDPADDELRKLQKARYNEAVGEMAGLYQIYLAGRGTVDSFVEAGKRLVHAGLDVYDKPADRITLLTQYVELTKAAERIADDLSTARGTMIELRRARYERLDAEIQLLRAKQAVGNAAPK